MLFHGEICILCSNVSILFTGAVINIQHFSIISEKCVKLTKNPLQNVDQFSKQANCALSVLLAGCMNT